MQASGHIVSQPRLYYSAVGSNWLFDVFLGLANFYLFHPLPATASRHDHPRIVKQERLRRGFVVLVFVCLVGQIIDLSQGVKGLSPHSRRQASG